MRTKLFESEMSKFSDSILLPGGGGGALVKIQQGCSSHFQGFEVWPYVIFALL